ncbi:MAG: serine/threonine protein kinase [Pseudohongiellaceae bacterium]|jgi:serine/threonine protein kinase
MNTFLIFIPRMLAVIAIAVVGIWLLIKVLMGLGWVVGNTARGIGLVFTRLSAFLGGMLSDGARFIGGTVTCLVFVPLTIFNLILGRWSAANHYCKALEREAIGVGSAAYRMALGHISKLFGLSSLTDGIERRVPEAMRRAPGPDTPGGQADEFDGFTIMGALPSGGSGARLFLAEPSDDKQRRYRAAGVSSPSRVVIKSFSLAHGSTMPQIVRESRALEAARKLGLVLEHELGGSRFYYVMPYVPGEDLNIVTQRLHDESGDKGLGPQQLDKTLGYAADLLQIVHRFHSNGLWHKDIKPNNIIVSEGRVQLVDLGLITPLASAMTLTTHGTEYFRDPELVRLAMRGVKVNEVDGVKFDIYAVGAVLFSMIENSFPAHGNLSQIKRQCPETLHWIVRRAMADIDNRYPTAVDMLADLRAVISAEDPHTVPLAKLPSLSGDPSLAATLGDEIAANFDASVLNPPPLDMTSAGRRVRDRETTQPATKRRGLLAVGVIAAVLIGTTVFAGLFVLAGAKVVPEPGPASTLTLFQPRQHTVDTKTPASNVRRLLPEQLWADHRPAPALVLVIDDVPEGTSERVKNHLSDLFGLLEQARFELVLGHRKHSLTDDLAIDLDAAARAVIGLGDPREAGTRERITQFLSDRENVIDGVLWLGRDESPDDIVYQAICIDDDDLNDIHRLLRPGHPVPSEGATAEAKVSFITEG